MKPRCLQGPREVMQSELHWKLLPAVECTDWNRDLRQMHEPWSRETMETVTDFILGSNITAGGDCSHETKRRLLLGRKVIQRLISM